MQRERQSRRHRTAAGCIPPLHTRPARVYPLAYSRQPGTDDPERRPGTNPANPRRMAMTPRIFPSTPAAPVNDALDDTIEDSFPASDPPSSNPAPTSVSAMAVETGSSWRVEGGL